MKKTVLGVFSVFFLFACQQDLEKQVTSVIEQRKYAKEVFQLLIEGDTCSYEIKKFYKNARHPQLADSLDAYAEISIVYPHFKSCGETNLDSILNHTIQELILVKNSGALAFNSVEERMLNFIEDYAQSIQEADFFGNSWSCAVDVKIELLTNVFVSLKFSELNFTGGVHPNYWGRYLNYNLQTGSKLKLKDLFLEGKEDIIKAVAKRYFLRSVDLPEDIALEETDFEFKQGEFTLPENFSLRKEGIFFSYNPYEIGPYSLGVIEFMLPFSAITSIVDPSVIELEVL